MQDEDRRDKGASLAYNRRKAIQDLAYEFSSKINLGLVVNCRSLERTIKKILLPSLRFNKVYTVWDLPDRLLSPAPLDILIVDYATRDPRRIADLAKDSPIICVSSITDGLEGRIDAAIENAAYSRAAYQTEPWTDLCEHTFSQIEEERLRIGVQCAIVEKAANDRLEEAIRNLSKPDSGSLTERFRDMLPNVSGYKRRALLNYLRMAEILVDGSLKDRKEIASKLYELNNEFGLREFEDNYHLFFNAAARASTMETLGPAIDGGNAHAANAYGLIVAKDAQEEGAKIIQTANEIVMSRKLSAAGNMIFYAKMAKSPSRLERELRLINLFNKTARRIINSVGLVYGSAIRIPKTAMYALNKIDRPNPDGETTPMDVLIIKYIPGESMFSYAHAKRKEAMSYGSAVAGWKKIQSKLVEQTLKAQCAVISMGQIVAQKDPSVVDIFHTKGSDATREHYMRRVSEKFIGSDSENAINLDVKARHPPQEILQYLDSHKHKGLDTLPPLQPYLAGVLWNVAPPNFHGALSHIAQDDRLLDAYRMRIMEDILPVIDIACGLDEGICIDLPQRNIIIAKAGLDSLITKGKLNQSDLAAIDREWIRNTPYLFEAITGWESSLMTSSETMLLREDLVLNEKTVAKAGATIPIMHYALARFAEDLPKMMAYYIPQSSGFIAPKLRFPDFDELYPQFCAVTILQEMARAGAMTKYLTTRFDSPTDRENHFKGLYGSFESIIYHSKELAGHFPDGSMERHSLTRLNETIKDAYEHAYKKFNNKPR